MFTADRKQLVRASLFVLAVVLIGVWLILRASASEQSEQSEQPPKSDTTVQQPAFDKQRFSLDDPASPWVIANKRRPLSPADYTPQLVSPNVTTRLSAANPEMQVSSQIAPAVEQLFAAAKADGLNLMLASGFRSYQQQVAVYNAEVRRNGQQAADRVSARPGHSEHQTGLAFDVEPASRQCEIEVCFGELPEGKWVAANAYKYGFVLRYAPESESITGYSYEPWHLRYVGTNLAAELQRLGNPPLETFFGLGPAADYQ
jgi:D-alanyl-D-alanine carboxypeptidase